VSRYLLDTHVFLWLQATPERIRPELLDELADSGSDLLLSAASSWEMAIKHALGKLHLPEPPDRYVPAAMRRSGVEPVPVGHPEALAVATLPPHHRDPFDRLLIAQAQLLDATILTVDAAFDAYEVGLVDPR
jgi:PIN domain nuclease of toxin-antitoxin system